MSDGQDRLDLGNEQQEGRVEEYKFEPIKGYPMLNWRGKRPFTSTQFYPAQLKEVHGPEVDGWRNKIFWGDNAQSLSHLLKHFRGKVKFCYIDPPFDSNSDYHKRIIVRSKQVDTGYNSFEEKQYSDIWNNDEYLQFLYERLILIRELLSPDGLIAVHTGWQKSHHIRLVLDEIFGNFINEVVWQKVRASKAQAQSFGNVHDLIFLYAKSPSFSFNKLYLPLSDEYSKRFDRIETETGRKYQLVSMVQAGAGPARKFGERMLHPGANRHWIWSQDRIDSAMREGLIEFTQNGTPRKKQYLDENLGNPVSDIWTDVYPVNSQSNDNTGYPTQKPVDLMGRFIEACTERGDLVLDAFAGSGSTLVAAAQLQRRFVGIDINSTAIALSVGRCLEQGVGIEVYNVNNYDLFRNPEDAKNILIEALEIQALASGHLYDGEKDGRMVKIMPVNRIATKADLSELVAGFDQKAFQRRQDENPRQPVEKILLVCMGHESDLMAELELQAKPFKIDVEVVDILRDKSQLEFKRDAEAKLAVRDGELVIENFYPMNLLQKLSLQQEQVGEWRELVDSVMVDWNYDGAVLQPAVVDVPGKDELVVGRYKVPADAGTIRVKITDLLSESWEGNIDG